MTLDEIKAKFKDSVAEAKEKLDELEAKRESLSDDLKKEFDEKMAQLKTKKDELEAKLEEIEDDSEDKWDEFKDKLGDASQSFKEGFKKLGSLFT